MTDTALLPQATRQRRRFSGLNQRQERRFTWIAGVIIVAVMSGWTVSIIDIYDQKDLEDGKVSPSVTRTVASSLLDRQAKPLPFISDAAIEFLDPIRGESGKIRAAFVTPGTPIGSENADPNMVARYETEGEAPYVSPDLRAPREPGIYRMAFEIDRAKRAIDDLNVITLVPFGEKKRGKIGLYYLGSWPYEQGGKPRLPTYANPRGFIEVTPENQSTNVSEHFRISQFLTKDQREVWPKYLLLDPKLLDKLELTISNLEAAGYEVKHVHVMSGFRTPRYNHGGGNTSGRANLSRHMYGDGADVYVDNNKDGQPDDLNRDGRVDVKDAELFSRMAEQVEREHPALVGGIGIYIACCGHGPFTHLDVRGYRARWRGTSGG